MRRLVVLTAVAAALVCASSAAAHPLGNFTVNRHGQIDVSGDRLYVKYVLDMAEIPTLQAGRIDGDALARRLVGGLRVTVEGRPARLVPLRHALTRPRGAGGLKTTRLEVVAAGPRLPRGRPISVAYHDDNDSGRIGWSEVVATARDGARLVRSSVPAESRSDELRRYPQDLLESPLAVRAAALTVEARDGPATAPALGARSSGAPARGDEGRVDRLVGGELSLLAVLAALAGALVWGAAHALTPGHGKAVVAAYLVGARGTSRHAVLLGVVVTLTHTAGVLALGLVTLGLAEALPAESIFPWLGLASGLLVLGVGASVLRARLRARHRGGQGHHRGHGDDAHDHRHHDHDHDHDHHHHHDHHRHDVPNRLSVRALVAVGVSGGILPCPSALVVLLAAVSLHRVAFGLALVLAFSLGLALTITGIGLVAVLARDAFARLRLDGRLVAALPAASALVILVAGALMTLRAIPEVL
jgi:ABC-type nickel/cobalt efflux system permease component RcnA